MSWYPLWNSLRIAAISSVLVFFLGILCAYYVARLPRAVKGILDVFLTLPIDVYKRQGMPCGGRTLPEPAGTIPYGCRSSARLARAAGKSLLQARDRPCVS